jgi:type II secretory pathway component PulK
MSASRTFSVERSALGVERFRFSIFDFRFASFPFRISSFDFRFSIFQFPASSQSPRPLRRDAGSLLIIALVAVSVVTLLVLSLGSWVAAQSTVLADNRFRREVRLGARNAAVLCLAERVAPDTNHWDAAGEPWAREPWERRDEGWVMRVSGCGWREEPGATVGLVDESGKVPLNTAPEFLLTALFREAAGVPEAIAASYAQRIADWRDADSVAGGGATPEATAYGTREQPWEASNRPFVCVEELAGIPSMAPGHYAAIAPYLTVEGSGRINLNTASEPVLRAAFQVVSAGDGGAAARLMGRMMTHRRAGYFFTAATAAGIGRDLGGLPADEATLLGRVESYVTVQSAAVSGIAEATPAVAWAAGRRGGRAHFTWNRAQARFTRWVEE